MATSVYDDKTSPPADDQLAITLGPAKTLWEDLVRKMTSQYAPLTETWIFGGRKWGWALRLKQRKRTVLYLTPYAGHFMAGFALGEKAVRAAHQSELPSSVLTIIDEATKYAEGRAVRVDVSNEGDIEIVEKLAAVKMAN